MWGSQKWISTTALSTSTSGAAVRLCRLKSPSTHFRRTKPWKSRFTPARAVKERVPVPMRQDSLEPPAARMNGKETIFSQRETACPTPNRCGEQRTFSP
jgi:hypothetical protein